MTRIDLDEKDAAKPVSLVAESGTDGNKLPTFDGITWDPFTREGVEGLVERRDRLVEEGDG